MHPSNINSASTSTIGTGGTMNVNLKYIIILIFFIPTVTITTTYALAMSRGDTTQILPFISATLDYPPESCIGTFGLSIASSFIMLLNIIRMIYVRAWIRRSGIEPYTTLHRLNVGACVVGMLFAICLVGIISVQYHLNHRVHNSFAATLFFSGTVYMCLQTYIDYRMNKARTSTKAMVLRLRIACSILGCLAYAPLIIFSQKHTKVFQTMGAAVEISMAAFFFLFYCSFHAEWRVIALLVDIQWDEFLPLINH